MVGIVVVSHSRKIAEGACELALQMAPKANVAASGGTKDGRIGIDVGKILAGIQKVQSGEGVVILVDIGSAVMSSETAIEMIPDNENIVIVDAPLVEGTFFGAVEASVGSPLAKVIEVLKESKNYKKI
ncbi:MAG TPA: dihydroxyacetone kinase phosphoryl donor subunit DhaM [Acetobacterium sp.]